MRSCGAARAKTVNEYIMNETITSTILRVLERTPQWMRHDLESKEAAIRTRAEETLAAMIANALADGDTQAGTTP
jgi:uncharacterized membrane-anchored protein YjiN (DUF445 family)